TYTANAAGALSLISWGAPVDLTNDVIVNAGTIKSNNNTGGNCVISGAVAVTGAGTIDNSVAFEISGIISGTGDVIKNGAGTLTLSGTNTYSGATTIGAGTLKLGAAGVIPDASAVTITETLDVNSYSETIGSIAGAGTIDNTSGSGIYTLTCGGNNVSTTFSGILKNTSGTLAFTKEGTGTLTLSGTNLYTGISNINNGILKIGSTTSLGSIAAGTTILTGAALDLNGISYANNEALNISGTGYSSSGVIFNSNASAASFAGAITLSAASTITTNNEITLSGTISNNQHFTKAGSNSLIFTSNTITVNNLDISAGTLVGGSSTINVYGNFTSSGIFTPNTNGVDMLGSGQQIIPAETFNNLTINNSAGAILAGNITINGTLTLTDGILTTDSYQIDLGSGGSIDESTPSATAPTSYVTGTVTTTRPLMQNVSNSFGGIGITLLEANKNNNSTEVIRVTGTACTGDGNTGILRYFTINPADDTGLDATMDFKYFDNEIVGHTEADLNIYKSTDSRVTWSRHAPIHDINNNILTLSDITSFSDWTASDGVNESLPIQLIEFDAIASNMAIEISWITATETNNDFFTIERTINGIEWVAIKQVSGAGNTSVMHEYNYTDSETVHNIVYYRLKQTDYDGTYSYSKIISINNDRKNNETVRAKYNKSKQIIIMECSEATAKKIEYIELINVLGQKVFKTSQFIPEIYTSQFNTGIYYIFCKYLSEESVVRIIIN
nr:autotransporter-associated beta strand repeat-containing protein [Bacteroidales bacterium]